MKDNIAEIAINISISSSLDNFVFSGGEIEFARREML